MQAWERIQITLDYIDEHLGEEFKIKNLADMAALSPFYFQRLFSRLVKKSVMEYIKLRRMAKATEELLIGSPRILDVALALGFSSHAQFTRVFKETFGMTPEQYRKNPVALNRMTKPQLSLQYTLIDENVPLVCDGIVLEISRKILTAPQFFAGMEAKMPEGFVEGLGLESGVDPLADLWNMIHEYKEKHPELLNGGDEIGIAYPCQEEGFFLYFAGTRMEAENKPEEFHSWVLTEGEYIVCSFEAEDFDSLVMDVLYKAQQYLFGLWLPNRNLQTEPYSVERYADHGEGTTAMEIWVKPVAVQ